jgi:hypothetical protein
MANVTHHGGCHGGDGRHWDAAAALARLSREEP